jgi:hypothetical protein
MTSSTLKGGSLVVEPYRLHHIACAAISACLIFSCASVTNGDDPTLVSEDVIRQRLNSGAISSNTVVLAAALGHSAARAVFLVPEISPTNVEALASLGPEALARAAVAGARWGLAEYGTDGVRQNTTEDIEAIERWILAGRHLAAKRSSLRAAVSIVLDLCCCAARANASGERELAGAQVRTAVRLIRSGLENDVSPRALIMNDDQPPAKLGEAIRRELVAWGLGESDPLLRATERGR